MSLDPKMKALLRKAAREHEPSAEDEARIYGALGKRIAAGGLAAAASAVAKTAPAQGVAKAAGLGLATKVVAIVGVVSAVGVGAYELARAPTPAPGRSMPSAMVTVMPPAAPKPSAPTNAPPPPTVEAPQAPAILAAPKAAPPPTKSKEPTVASAAALVEAPSPAMPPPVERPHPASTNFEPSTTPAPSALESEIALLRDSDRALRDGTPSAALAKLDEHAQRFPHGSLAEERTVSRIVVLCALGRTAEARAAGNAFLAARPSSPHAGRVRASCAGATN